MRLFRHTIAEYTCSNHCGYHLSVVGADLCFFHMIVAVMASAVSWWLTDDERFSWHVFAAILAGELILVFAAGFFASLLRMPFLMTQTKACKNCRAPMFFAGRHFDPAGSPGPRRIDLAILIIFTLMNGIAWVFLLKTRIG